MDPGGVLEVFIFGVLGPTAVFMTLTYLEGLLQKLEAAQAQATAVNQNLEKTVVERTQALQASIAELEQANMRLQELDQMKSDFVSLVSHELRAPLATLNGGLEMTQHYADKLPATVQRVLELLTTETERLTQFVQTLLDVSQLQTGKLQFNYGPVAVKPLLKRAAEIVLGSESERVTWQIPVALPPVWADETYIEQIVRNLVRNAQKYTLPHSPIVLSAFVQNQVMHICVTDSGPGIPQEKQRDVFDRFYRITHGQEHKVSGWGLGLYFARMLTEAQDGTLTLQSPVHPQPDAPGTRFILTLPIAEEEPEDGEFAAD
ncbi:MAG: hypothetical protein IPH82_27880 [Chloroflexi bacterium]|nr:hypothetical protein [Chloroflexota bacterium]